MGALLFIHNGNRYPFQRSRPPRRRPRYPSLGTLRQCRLRIVCFRASTKAHSLHCISSSGKIIRFCRSPIMAYFPRAISSLGAGIQLSARFAISERKYPASNRPSWAECPQLPPHQFTNKCLFVVVPQLFYSLPGGGPGRPEEECLIHDRLSASSKDENHCPQQRLMMYKPVHFPRSPSSP